MIDLSKLGGPGAGPDSGASPSPAASAIELPDFAPPTPTTQPGGEAPWDTLGRVLWGTKEEGGTLGQIPLVGDIMRFPGEAARNVVGAGGVGLGALVGGASELLGRLPAQASLTDPYRLGQVEGSRVSPLDPKYGGSAQGAIDLLRDLKVENGGGNIARQFMILGQWQQANDPEAFKAWQETLEAAKASGGIGSRAGELLGNYIREWGTTYFDMTPAGLEGWLDVAPELAFTANASVGQGLHDALKLVFSPQQHAEIGAAQMSGSQAGLGGALQGKRIADDYNDMGSRLNELLHLSDTDPDKLSPAEAAAVYGLKEMGWTGRHAYAYLQRHGQGYSSDAGSQLLVSMALDPTFAIGGAGSLGSKVGQRAALGYAKTAESASRIQRVWQAGAKAIGTTVSDVRDGPLGGAFKAARTVADPFSVFEKTPEGVAKVDVFAAAGVEGTRRGFGAGPVSDAMARARQWGVAEMADRAFGQTAMNFARKWAGNTYVDNLLKSADISGQMAVTEEAIQQAGRNAPKDAATRLADYVYRNREFYLNEAGVEQLATRLVKIADRNIEDARAAVATMTRDEQAVWHALSYSEAWRDFKGALAEVPFEEWGRLGPKVQDLVILNPNELDLIAATHLRDTVAALKGKKAVEEWNQAARRYSLVEGLGRVTSAAQLERKLATLDRIINEGGLHMALNSGEMVDLPKAFTQKFLGKWSDADGIPMWRFGWKPQSVQAAGLIRNSDGNLFRAYDVAIENVTDAIAVGSPAPLTDALGRIVPGAIKGSRAGQAARAAYDSLDVALRTASDMVTGERVMTSMEQSFRAQMRAAGYGDRIAKDVFRASREYAQEHMFTLAGMGPDEFWRASKDVLGDIVDARVAKRDVFTMLATAAGGDMRTLGLTGGMTQRIRSGLVARGLDPNNYLGAVTVKVYNTLRYALNPTFFLQAEFDAPWFNMYRGVMFDLRGRAPKVGTPTWEMQRVAQAMSDTSLARHLQMDFTERIATIGWQREVVDQLRKAGLETSIGGRVRQRLGRLILNNELLYLNSRAGDIVVDAIDTTKRALQERAAMAATPEEAALWTNQQVDVERVFEFLTEEMTGTLGRAPTKNELGLRYLTEMIEDSHLEVRSQDGLLNYQKVAQKGAYHAPANIGELRPLDIDYGAESLGLPNVHNAIDLRDAIGRGATTLKEVEAQMKELGYHPDHIKRFSNRLMFNWRHYFDGLRGTLDITKAEMQGVEDLVAREAKALHMDPADYLSQVLTMTAGKGKKAGTAEGLTENMRLVVDILRLADKGELGMEQLSKVIASRLQPSMRATLLDHFQQQIAGPNGLIEQAMKADPKRAQDLNLVLEDLRGGWGDAADKAFKDLVARRAGGEVAATGEQLPQPWKDPKINPYAANTELVRVNDLVPFREIDREVTPKYRGDDAYLDELTDTIRREGFMEPVILDYDPEHGLALLGEGNHRLAVAQRLGLDNIPTRVVRTNLSGDARAVSIGDQGLTPRLKPNEDGYFPGDTSPSAIGFRGPKMDIADPEVERAARYFSEWVKTILPDIKPGEVLTHIVENVPSDGASPYNFTQGVLMNTLAENFRIAEKDAIRLAHMQTERSVLERSMNHPFFALYPSSYFWGKVIPETFRFIAYEPFGVRTSLGAQAYLKTKQSIELQSLYDDRLRGLWQKLGKSAVVGLFSYLSPSMPWEDMASNLPPWVRSLSRGEDFMQMLSREFDTFSPERWVNHFVEAGQEVTDVATDVLTPEQEAALTQMNVGGGSPGGSLLTGGSSFQGPVTGVELGPVLEGSLADLQSALSGR